MDGSWGEDLGKAIKFGFFAIGVIGLVVGLVVGAVIVWLI